MYPTIKKTAQLAFITINHLTDIISHIQEGIPNSLCHIKILMQAITSTIWFQKEMLIIAEVESLSHLMLNCLSFHT